MASGIPGARRRFFRSNNHVLLPGEPPYTGLLRERSSSWAAKSLCATPIETSQTGQTRRKLAIRWKKWLET
jgi:hypothetical protein